MKKIWKIFVGVIFLAVCSGCGIKKEQKKTIEDTKEKIYRECEMLAEDYQSIYENAAKENALYELSTIQKSMDYFGKYGYAVIDSYNQLDMVQSIVSAKYSCGFSNTLISSIIVGERYLNYFTTITEDRLWQLLAKPVFRWRNRSGLSMNAAKAV